MSGPYKPEDFRNADTDYRDWAAEDANLKFEKFYQERLRAELEKAPKVYGFGLTDTYCKWVEEPLKDAEEYSHTARLMAITELEKSE